MLIIYKI